MNPIPIQYRATAKLIGYGIAVLALFGLIYWAAILPRQQLSSVRAKHAETLAAIAKSAAEAAEKAKLNVQIVDKAKRDAAETYRKGIEDAHLRGVAAAADIATGKRPVGRVWQDRCPQPATGTGPGPAGGNPQVSADRAAAIGRVLTIGGQADAGYAQCYARLEAAQEALNQCYDKPAR